MKAYIVRDEASYLDFSTVVFAETAGKARAIAIHTDACEDAEFTDISARRIPALDKYYKDGKTEMDWYDPKDRVALVKEAGFSCSYEVDFPPCYNCPAGKLCDRYEEEQKHDQI